MPTNRLQYTIRGIPSEVDRKLRAMSKRQGVSLNNLFLKILSQATGSSSETDSPQKDPFEFMYNSWIPDRKVDESLKEQRKIDKDLWR